MAWKAAGWCTRYAGSRLCPGELPQNVPLVYILTANSTAVNGTGLTDLIRAL